MVLELHPDRVQLIVHVNEFLLLFVEGVHVRLVLLDHPALDARCVEGVLARVNKPPRLRFDIRVFVQLL